MSPPKRFPTRVIIIGAGVFGLSTALALEKRYPPTKVTVIDRLVPPVADGESVDTTRCIRADYDDPIYARLARIAQEKIEKDADLRQHLYKQGMTFVNDGEPTADTDIWKAQLALTKSWASPEQIVELPTRQAIYQRIHGENAQPPPVSGLEGGSKWNKAYSNLADGFIDARQGIQVYYDRCVKASSIEFRCGSAIERIKVEDGRARGVVLENGDVIEADMVVVAAGAWSNKLVYLGNRANPFAIEVAWFKVTPEEEARWKHMAITTNYRTGLNVFPPYRGEIKVLRRSDGYKNTMTVLHPEDRTKTIDISYPRTLVSHPTDMIPADAETSMRRDLKEIMPPLADRPFERTRLCWISRAPTHDFLVAPHPRTSGIHLATGGSAHGWKFLPIIGDFIVDSMEGTLAPELKHKWAFYRDSDAPSTEPRELRDVVRHRL
ncbi:hypothetical protein NM208_g3942 [Fusarium decemcellulare]|uniref:Uncharacterized protein n=1 Tax=Fusarium decemcellulare TaxID=57161 RepID=A0ACC1SM75_9HYPO|nr:hypothetical protein NM208_g3942 [Fusarium decemcellulare]